MIPAELARLVGAARRRMRVNRTLGATGPVLLGVAGAWLLWALAARVFPLPPVGVVVAGGLGGAAVLALLSAAAVRIPPVWAAWAADRWLGTRDLYSTAVELALRGADEGLAARQVLAADAAAAGVDRFPQPFRTPTRTLGIGALLLVMATGLSVLPNPQDEIRARQAAEQAAVAEEVERLRSTADELGELGDDGGDLPTRLEELAAQLEDAGIEEALERLAEARNDLSRQLDRDLAAQRTALAGLARELENRPLAGADSAQAQLDELAAQLEAGALDSEELDSLAERLAALAGSMAAGPEGVRGGLSDAAQAVGAGDPAGAAAALGAASEALGQAQAHLDGQAATAQAQAAVAAAEQRLRAAGQGQGDGDGQGQGDGDGQGQGDGDGQGQGDGDGQGQGDGDGQGQGGGGGGGGGQPTGQVSDSGAREGTGSGRGASQDGDGSGRDEGRAGATVFDPASRVGGEGDDVHLPGSAEHEGEETVQGRQSGRGERTGAIVPYREVLARYREQAARVIERDGYPVRLRRTVQSYFDRL